MYPKNTASPRALRAKVVSAADGSPLTTGVVAYHIQGVTRAAVSGDAAAHVANGIWSYTPTQAETNYDEFAIEFYHVDAVGDGPLVSVITGVDISAVKLVIDRTAVLCIGDVTDAQTASEVFVYAGITANVAGDASGNRTITWS